MSCGGCNLKFEYGLIPAGSNRIIIHWGHPRQTRIINTSDLMDSGLHGNGAGGLLYIKPTPHSVLDYHNSQLTKERKFNNLIKVETWWEIIRPGLNRISARIQGVSMCVYSLYLQIGTTKNTDQKTSKTGELFFLPCPLTPVARYVPQLPTTSGTVRTKQSPE